MAMRLITLTSEQVEGIPAVWASLLRCIKRLFRRDDVAVVATRRTFKVVRIGHKKGPHGSAGGPCVGAGGARRRAGAVRDQNVKITPTA
jgi:hypothetical protein